MIDDDHTWTGIEWISRVGAVDAMLRRANQKQRDDPRVSRVVLVVADTVRNRRALRAAIAIVRADYPLDTREVLAALRAGRAPALNGIVLMRIPGGHPQRVHNGGNLVDGSAREGRKWWKTRLERRSSNRNVGLARRGRWRPGAEAIASSPLPSGQAAITSRPCRRR